MLINSSSDPAANPRLIRFAEIGLIILSAAFACSLTFAFPFYPIFSESDHLIFAYEGWRMYGGEWIYRDFFEFTLPGSQTYYFLLFNIFGPAYWITAASVPLIGAACCWVLLRVSKHVIPSSLYLLPVVVFIFFGFRWFGLDPSHRMFSPIFMMGAVLVLMRGTTLPRLLIAGLLCALTSFFTQQRGVVMVASIALFLLVESRMVGQGLFDPLKKILLLSGAFTVFLLIMCVPFIVAAGPHTFLESTVVYPALYYKFGSPNNLGVFLVDLKKALSHTTPSGIFALLPTALYAIFLPIAAVAAAVWLVRKRRTLQWSRLRAPILIGIVSILSLIVTTAPNQYRLYQISMPLLVFVVWWLAELIRSDAARKRLAGCVTAFALVISVGQAIRFQSLRDNVRYWDTPTGTLGFFPSEQMERYLWLSKRLSPGDTFFEVYEPFLYFPLQLKNPTRFGQIWNTDYTRPEHVAEVVADLQHDPPAYILWDNEYNISDGVRLQGDHTAPLVDFVNSEYIPVGAVYRIDVRSIQVWARKRQ